MNSSTFRFTLDLRTTQSQVALPVMLGDTAREMYINLCDGATPYYIADGCLATIVIARPNGTILQSFCTIEGNAVIRYKFDDKTAIVEGLHDCQVILVSADGEVAGSAKFSMVVSERVYNKDDMEIPDEDYLAIDAILVKEAERVDAEEARELAEANREAKDAEREAKDAQREAKEAERQEEENHRQTQESVRDEQEADRQFAYEQIRETLGEVKNYIHIAPRHITSIDTIYDSVDDIPSEAGVYVVKGGTFAALYEYNGSGCEFVCNLQYLGLYLVTSGEKQGLYYCTDASEAYFMPATASGGGEMPTIEISEDGYWVINGEKTEYKASGEGGGKLYRHDIHISEYNFSANDIWLTIYNSDPTNYSAEAVFTEEDENGEPIYDYTEPLTAENFAFLPESPILASGCIDTSGDGGCDYIVTAIEYDSETGIYVYGMYWEDGYFGTADLNWTLEFEKTGTIRDTVTEIGATSISGGGSDGNVDTESIIEEANAYTDAKIEEALASSGGSGGGKLYRHDIELRAYVVRNDDWVRFSFYNTDPTDYSSYYDEYEDEETGEFICEPADFQPLFRAILGHNRSNAYAELFAIIPPTDSIWSPSGDATVLIVGDESGEGDYSFGFYDGGEEISWTYYDDIIDCVTEM